MEKTKTIREWLNELPEPIRSRAIRNAENDLAPLLLLKESVSSLNRAIDAAFFWDDTPEGFYFWSAVSIGKTPELPDNLNENQ